MWVWLKVWLYLPIMMAARVAASCQCSICGRKFNHSSSLCRHVKNIHHDKENSKTGTISCTETNCNERYVRSEKITEFTIYLYIDLLIWMALLNIW